MRYYLHCPILVILAMVAGDTVVGQSAMIARDTVKRRALIAGKSAAAGNAVVAGDGAKRVAVIAG